MSELLRFYGGSDSDTTDNSARVPHARRATLPAAPPVRHLDDIRPEEFGDRVMFRAPAAIAPQGSGRRAVE